MTDPNIHTAAAAPTKAKPDLKSLPKWFQFAVAEIGTREQPSNRGPAIRNYIKYAGAGSEGDPWCAIFANAMLEKANVPGTRSASSQSFTRDKRFLKIIQPFYGCVVVYWRGSKNSGLGHVGFYNGEEGDYISTVGGNESDMVREEMFPRASGHFGFVGYYMPANYVRTEFDKVGALPVFIPHGTKGRSLAVT